MNSLNVFSPDVMVAGDLIYGKAKDRENAIENMNALQSGLKSGVPYFVDHIMHPGRFVDLWSIAFTGDSLSEEQLKWQEMAENYQSFRKKVRPDVFEHEVEGDIRGFVKNSRPGTSPEHWQLRWSRKKGTVSTSCKVGLIWNILQRENKIHFILADEPAESMMRKEKTSFTGSELRFVYRIWNDLPKSARERIHFYQKTAENCFVETQAPWEKPEFQTSYVPSYSRREMYKELFAAYGKKD